MACTPVPAGLSTGSVVCIMYVHCTVHIVICVASTYLMWWTGDVVVSTIQYNNGIYRALFTKCPGALTQLAVICSAK